MIIQVVFPPSSVKLDWSSLETRRQIARLTMFYKILQGSIVLFLPIALSLPGQIRTGSGLLSVMLQHDPIVKRCTDIHRLLGRWLNDWRGEKFDSFVCEAEYYYCARQFVRPRRKDEKDHAIAVFTHLMLHGQVHSAVQFITDRVPGGGVLHLDSPSNVSGLSVLGMC